MEGMQSVSFGGMDLALLNAGEGWLEVEGYDLTGVKSIILLMAWREAPAAGGDFEVHLGSPDGELIGSGTLANPSGAQGAGIPLAISKPQEGKKTIYLTYKRHEAEDPGMMALTGMQFQ